MTRHVGEGKAGNTTDWNPSLAITLEKGIGVSTQIIIYTGRFDNKFFICGVVGLAYGV